MALYYYKDNSLVVGYTDNGHGNSSGRPSEII